LINACVFDLDGTLLNSLKDIANTTNYVLQKNGFPQWDLDQYRDFVCDGLPTLLQRALAENYSPEIIMHLADDFTAYYNQHYNDFTVPYAEVPELLNNLLRHGMKIAVLSNKPDHFVKIIIEEMYPGVDFSLIQGKTDKFPQKPDPASLINLLEELQVSPDQALYIGDSNVDVYTAHNAGLKVVGVTWGFRERSELEEAGADYIVDSPDDILRIVNAN